MAPSLKYILSSFIFSVAIAFEAETVKCTTKQPMITRKYQCANANFDAMSVYLYSIDWMQVIHTNPSASSMWTEFVKLLQYVTDACVPSFAVPVK